MWGLSCCHCCWRNGHSDASLVGSVCSHRLNERVLQTWALTPNRSCSAGVTGQVLVLCQTGRTHGSMGYKDFGGAQSSGEVEDKVLPPKPVQLHHKQNLCTAGTLICCHLVAFLMSQNGLIHVPIMGRVCVPVYSLRLVLNILNPKGSLLPVLSSSLNANTKALRFSWHRP